MKQAPDLIRIDLTGLLGDTRGVGTGQHTMEESEVRYEEMKEAGGGERKRGGFGTKVANDKLSLCR